MSREFVQGPRGDLILHAALPLNLPWFSCVYPFLSRFSRTLLEVFWCSKCVMQHIVGKLLMSTFQRYKVYVNQSLDGRVMTLGSWGAEAFLRVFPAKIPVKRRKPPANRELHVIAGVIIFTTHPGSRINSSGRKMRQVFVSFFLTFCLCLRVYLT